VSQIGWCRDRTKGLGVTATLENERKYSVDGDAGLPPLDQIAGVSVVPQDEFTLQATYYDTADLRLLASRVTLRQRTGGADAGWHLKLPAPGEARTEVYAPPGGDEVPAELADLVIGLRRGAPLQPVARLTTQRRILNLQDASGRVLAEVADDQVTGQSLVGNNEPVTWREIEVELKDGDAELLDAVHQVLTDAGIQRSADTSKAGRVLRPNGPPAEPSVSLDSSAGEVALAYLRGQARDLLAWDPEVRRDTYDSVHKARVATRRLRSALRTYRDLFDRAVTDPVRDELRWLGQTLGEARDREVMRDRLLAVIREHPPELVIGPVAARLETELGGGYREHHRAAIDEMSSPRYFALLDALEKLYVDPPYTPIASDPASDVLPGLARKTWRRVRRLAETAEATGQDSDLHEVRKAAKQARYAGESLTSVYGADAKAYAAAMEQVQEVLGEHQDAVVTREALRDMGVRAHLAGDNAFTYGLLAGLEEARARSARETYASAWAKAGKRKLRNWMA
jgi:CHAD domain-containing protein